MLHLYADERIDLPIASTYRNPKGSKFVYLTIGSYYNDQRKQRHRQVCIGHAVTEQDGTEKLIPNINYYKYVAKTQPPADSCSCRGKDPYFPTPLDKRSERSRVGIGYTLAVVSLMIDLGILPILKELLGSERAQRAVAIVSYYVQCQGQHSLTEFKAFMEDNFSFLMEPFDESRVCDEFKRIDEQILEFFERRWIRQALTPGDTLYYDVTSLSTMSEQIDGAEPGYNCDHEDFDQINIGLMCQSRRPLFIVLYDGSINDASNYNYVLNTIKALGLPDDFDVIYDGGFDKSCLSHTVSRGHNVMFSCSFKRYRTVREAVLQHQDLLRPRADNVAWNGSGSIISTRLPFTFGDIPGELLIYFDSDKYSLQLNSLIERKAKLEEELKEQQGFPCNQERYKSLFQLRKSRGRKGFSYQLDEQAFNDAAALCGISTFFSTRSGRDPVQSLMDYRALDTVEKMFRALKNELLDGRVRVHSREALHGKAFFLFIALIVYKEFERLFQPIRSKYHTTTAHCLNELKRIVLVKENGAWVNSQALTKFRKELLRATPIKTLFDPATWS